MPHDPVARVEAPGYEPFWAVTKHADILAVVGAAAASTRARRASRSPAPAQPMLPPMDLVVLLDPPRHGPMRKLVLPWFTPKAVRARRDELDAHRARGSSTTRSRRDALRGARLRRATSPRRSRSRSIAWILGVPRNDWDLLFRLSNEVIGKDDPEFRRDGESPGQTDQAGARRDPRATSPT